MPCKAPGVAIFDVEGTLIDCVPLILESWRQTLRSGGHIVSLGRLQRYSGMDGLAMLDELIPDVSHEGKQQLLQEQGERYRRDFMPKARGLRGVTELFESLKRQGVRLAIATTCQKDELACYDEQLHVRELADVVVCGDTVKHGKPDPALLRQCLTALRETSGSDVVAVGDTPFDAIAAAKLGIRCAGVLTGGFSEASLRGAGCERVFDQVASAAALWSDAGPATATVQKAGS